MCLSVCVCVCDSVYVVMLLSCMSLCMCVRVDLSACLCVVCSPDGVAAAYRNDVRQLHVNHVADHVGAGIGTGRFYGVPGTNLHFDQYYRGYDGYKYPAQYHGYDWGA